LDPSNTAAEQGADFTCQTETETLCERLRCYDQCERTLKVQYTVSVKDSPYFHQWIEIHRTWKKDVISVVDAFK
jgi:hypothetical protein